MDKNLNNLHKVDALLAKLVDGNNLTFKEAEDLIYHIFVYDIEGSHFATWLGANHAKGETADELLGFLNATKRLATSFGFKPNLDKLTGLSGTGGGKFKSFNVSTTASFVVASAGYTVANEVYYAITSPTGSADVFTALGVNFIKLTKEKIEKTLREVGICPIITPFISPGLENRGKLALKFFVDRQVRTRTIFNLVSNLQLPLSMTHRIYGCYSDRYLQVLANLFMKMGYKKTLTFYADIGMPEISNVGKTTIVEQNGNQIRRSRVSPSDLGIKEVSLDQIKTGGKEQNIQDFINILKGKVKGPKSDLVAVNAAASLYALEDVRSIKEGVEKAKEILYSGKSYKVLESLVERIGNPKDLKAFQT